MPVRVSNWRTPIVIVVCGCLLSLISFGPRSTFGFFLTPMTAANGWGRDVFAFALGARRSRSPARLPTGLARSGC